MKDPDPRVPRLQVTLPAHNEAAQLETSVRRVVAFLVRQAWTWELTMAENGSTDRTGEIAEGLARELGPRVRVLRRPVAGRGGALRQAWLESEAELLSYMDVDLSTDLACLPALLAPLQNGAADVAIGSRLLAGSETTRGWKRECLSRGYNALLHAALGLGVRDAQCGFKALTRAAAQALLPQVRDDGWFFDTELLVRAERGGWRVIEVPVRWVDDPGSTVNLPRTVWRDLCGVWRVWRERHGRRLASRRETH